MIGYTLKEGMEVARLTWDETDSRYGDIVAVGRSGVKRIVVAHEAGGLGPALWFAVEMESGNIIKHNGAYISNVEVAEEPGPEDPAF